MTTDLAYPFEPGDTLSADALNAAIALGQSNQWRNGSGPPVDAVGTDGDMYLDSTSGAVYQRTEGVYLVTANIRGPAGGAGPAGAAGPAGPPGPVTSGVSEVDTTGPGITGGPITSGGALAVQWNAGTVTALGSSLAITGGSLGVVGTGSATPTGAAGGDLSGTYPNPTLKTTGVTAGVYGDADNVAQITLDAKGRVTTVGVVAISGTGGPKGKAGGDLAGNYPSPTLVTTAVTAGSYGDASHVPTFTVDAKGRLTAAGTAAIAGGAPSGTAGGDLNGTYPNPIVARTGGVAFANSATTDTTNAANISSGTLNASRLPTTGVTAGTYTLSTITVDATGRLTAASTGSASGGPALPTNNADYVIGVTQPGTTGNNQKLLVHALPHAITLPASLAGSSATALTAATASTAFVLAYKRGGTTTTIATFTFAAAGTTATISGVVIPTLAAGDILTITGPATADVSLADIGFSILASKQ